MSVYQMINLQGFILNMKIPQAYYVGEGRGTKLSFKIYPSIQII